MAISKASLRNACSGAMANCVSRTVSMAVSPMALLAGPVSNALTGSMVQPVLRVLGSLAAKRSMMAINSLGLNGLLMQTSAPAAMAAMRSWGSVQGQS